MMKNRKIENKTKITRYSSVGHFIFCEVSLKDVMRIISQDIHSEQYRDKSRFYAGLLSHTFQGKLINGFREPFNNIYTGVAVYETPDNGNTFVFKDFNKVGDRMWI